MAQAQMKVALRQPFRFRATMFLLRWWIWAGDKFPEGLVSVEVDPKVLAGLMQYRLDRGRWRELGD